ncbi:MAG: type II toxin-antitoxin system RelB/DinJ family antitoxin [Planctomycetaceae bacterium]|jgi:DNA-damage-inducible protein J|nr:type II toxin-antitoxin system RelB/DinJ family antitoxin [Planctomycetaceae bacterium]
MATIRINVDENIKNAADSLFAQLGLDTPTAIRMFLNSAIEHNGLPFKTEDETPGPELLKTIEDIRLNQNLHGPFNTVEEAMVSLLED